MLEELSIQGLGVIEEAVLPLGAGLTVVTGETGAGKTMVLTGLTLLFGGRADSYLVRAGAGQARIDGRLELARDSPAAQRVRDAGGDLDADTGLVLRRVVSATGRSRAYVGGAPAPVAVLGQLAEELLAVHGQADQARLTRPAQQRAALDRYAGLDLAEYRAAYRRWREAVRELAHRTERVGELRREAELLQYGLTEIEQAGTRSGEDVELTAQSTRLAHADALRMAARAAHDALLGDFDDPAAGSDVTALLGTATHTVELQAGADPQLDALAVRLRDLAVQSAELGADLGGYGESLDADPARLEQLEARRATLGGLVRKYAADVGEVGAAGGSGDIDAVLAWAQRARTRLRELDVSDEAIAALRTERDAAATDLARLATALSSARAAAAERLGEAASGELTGLAMPTARLSVQVRPRALTADTEPLTVADAQFALTADGADEVQFCLQPHTDAPPLPLARGASGGELSRVMLALELCLARTEPVPTMVFDEVDAGVGGRAAVEVGRRLARLAREHQVVVVTHLPQVAAFADRHIVVDKPDAGRGAGDAGQVIASDVRVVAGDERVGELARMLAGSDSGAARKHAAELLARARKSRT